MLAACGRSRAPPNVILVSIDTLRADHLGCYGYGEPTSPWIDGLASRGVLFTRAFSQASWTLPSHASMLTSRYPSSHGVETPNRTLPDSIPLLSEVLAENGYSTAAFVTWVFVSKEYGFARGFDTFTELLPPKDARGAGTKHSVKAADFADMVGEWAHEVPTEPFFLFLHLFDPHLSYSPPLSDARLFDPDVEDTKHGNYGAVKPFIKGLNPEGPTMPATEVERVAALYDGEIHYTDTQLGRLFGVLEDAGLMDDTLVVLTSDHGEELGEHGSMEGHQWTVYEETTHVPLLIRLPDEGPAGLELDPIVQSIDIAPTILDVLGIDPPSGFQGRSLLPAIRGEALDERPAFSSTRRFGRKDSVRTDRYKLILTHPSPRRGGPTEQQLELYDLAQDPGEQTNVYEDFSGPGPKLLQVLRDRLASERRAASAKRPDLSAESQRRLQSLGYGGGDTNE
jgi:arylsulfatase A-like enzyme